MVATAPSVVSRQSPYRGLVPFSDEDAEFFFGRDRERQIIIANLLASRLTVIYGASGVGKSSLLRAGVVHKLRTQARHAVSSGEIPEFLVVEFSSWRDNPVAGLNKAIQRSVTDVFGEEGSPFLAGEPSEELDVLLRDWTETIGADLLILLDQFEEFFLYHGGTTETHEFALGLARAVNDPDLRVNFLVAIREDAHALLDQFKGMIHSNIFGNNLRIEHLDDEAARQAITRPIERYNELLEGDKVSIEPELVDRVLEEVTAGKVSLGGVGEAGLNASDGGPVRIEAPYLQLVMSRLWDEEKRTGSRLLRLATLERLGGAEQIVHSHLDEAMSDLSPEQRELATRIFRFLVTPGGTKIAHVADDLSQYVDVSVSEVEDLLRDLDRVRIVRSTDPPPGETGQRYEIYHDVLAAGILEWRRERETSESVRRVRRRAATLLAAALGVIFVLIAGFIVIQNQRDLAEQQRVLAEEQRALSEEQSALTEAGALTAMAREALEADPEDAVRLAVESIDVRRTPEGENVLRRAFSELRNISVVDDHDGVVWTAAFSPDGEHVVTAGQDGVAVVADTETGEPVSILRGHGEDLNGAMFTPDGERIVTAGDDGTARLWELSNGEELAVFDHPDEAYNAQHEAGVFRRDVSRVSTSGPGTTTPEGDRVPTGALSADGRSLVTTGGDSAWIWDLTNGELAARLQHPPGPNWPAVITSASFSPDGRQILTAAQDGIVRLWDTNEYTLVSQMANETDVGVIQVNAAVFDPHGGRVAFGDQHGGLVLWEPGSEEEPIRISAFNGPISQVSFSSDGNLVLSRASLSWRIYRWNGDFVAEPGTETDFINSARFSPDGRYVVTAANDGLTRVIDATSGGELVTLGGHENIVWSAEFDATGERVVTGSEDGTARVWELGLGQALAGHDVWVNTIQFSPEGDRVLTAGGDGRAYVWSGADASVVRELETDEAGFLYNWVASFEETGERVIAASQESGIVRIWSVDDGGIQECCETGFTLRGAVPIPTRPSLVAVLDSRSTLSFWDLTETSDTSRFQEIETVQNVVFSNDGSFFITVDRDESIARVWDFSTFEEVAQWEMGLVQSWVLSSDDRNLVVLDRGGQIKVWNVSDGESSLEEPVLAFDVRAGQARTLALSEDGNRIVTGGSDGSVGVWDASTGRPLGLIRAHSGTVNAVDIAADGRIASAATDGARISTCRACGPIDEVEEKARRHLAALDS